VWRAMLYTSPRDWNIAAMHVKPGKWVSFRESVCKFVDQRVALHLVFMWGAVVLLWFDPKLRPWALVLVPAMGIWAIISCGLTQSNPWDAGRMAAIQFISEFPQGG
jgi:hypothetical protein